MGHPRKTPSPLFKVFFINKSLLSELSREEAQDLESDVLGRVSGLPLAASLSFVARLLPPGFPNLKNGGDRLWPACLPVSSGLAEVTCVRKHVSHITISLSFLSPAQVS